LQAPPGPGAGPAPLFQVIEVFLISLIKRKEGCGANLRLGKSGPRLEEQGHPGTLLRLAGNGDLTLVGLHYFL
jgi:hypothetical protein